MSRYLSWFCVVFAALMPSAAGAHMIAIDPPESVTVSEPATSLAPPMSITERYVPAQAPRAPLVLLVDDTPAIASRPVVAVPPSVVEEIGGHPAAWPSPFAPGDLRDAAKKAGKEAR
ncbi:MAG: hypothetical protein K1X51_04955 [Rhodospirillaceae bacterium]|nr:hypothetical protein [Rhodospirillaceae bacterium]